mgnify:CR=1 FL=1
MHVAEKLDTDLKELVVKDRLQGAPVMLECSDIKKVILLRKGTM